MNAGEKILRVLNQRLMSQADLARAAGLKASTVSSALLEGGMNLRTAQALARALNISLDWLADDAADFPTIPAGETLSFSRLLTEAERQHLARLAQDYGHDVVLAAAVRSLAATAPGQRGAILGALRETKEATGTTASVKGATAGSLHMTPTAKPHSESLPRLAAKKARSPHGRKE